MFSGCVAKRTEPVVPSDNYIEETREIMAAMDSWERKDYNEFLTQYNRAVEQVKKSRLPSAMRQDENMPKTFEYLLSRFQGYNNYSAEKIRLCLEVAILSTDDSGIVIDHIPGKTLGADLYTNTFFLDRAQIAPALDQMLDDWGETAFAIDDELIRHVSYFLKFYAVYISGQTNRTIKRSQDYLPYIVNVFDQYRLPKEIAFALPFVESSFNSSAKSGVGAVGMFQFMKGTAKNYGLKVNNYTDERKDYKKASVACAKYLRNNRNVFASVVLALGSYHHGTGNVTKVLLAASDMQERSFRPVFESKKIGPYSKEYIPQCLAAALIFRYLEHNSLTSLPEINISSKRFKSAVNINQFSAKRDDLLALNPDLQKEKILYPYASSRGYVLLTQTSGIKAESTKGSIVAALERGHVISNKTGQEKDKKQSKIQLEKWPSQPVLPVSRGMKISGTPKYVRYVFQQGNDLAVVAKIFGTRVSELKKDNKYLRKRKAKAGDILIIKGLAPTTQKIGGGGYLCGKRSELRVRKGETLRKLVQRVKSDIRSACPESKWEMGADFNTDLIYYWNKDDLKGIGPGDALPDGLLLTVYSDYLWKKRLKKPVQPQSSGSVQASHISGRKLGPLYISYIIQDENITKADPFGTIAKIFYRTGEELLKDNPGLKKYWSHPATLKGKNFKVKLGHFPSATQKFGYPGVACGRGKDGSDNRFVMNKGESLESLARRAVQKIRSCGGQGKGITPENVLFWNADQLKKAGIITPLDKAAKFVKLTIYADYY